MTTAQMFDQRPLRPGADQACVHVFALAAHALTCFRLRRAVEAGEDLGWLGSTDSVQTAGTVIRTVRPDVLVLHNVLDPDARLTEHLTATCPWLAVVVLVEDRGPADRYANAGVQAVLPVNAPPAVVAASVRLAHTTRGGQAPYATARAQESDRLSGRQQQILSLIADGNSYAEVGRLLFISTETVRTHVKQILRRLNARDRAHAVSLAYQAGLLGRSGRAPT
ncbi:DNA-binding response regulator [Actinophytocola sp. NPDC049390]|uniref:DNA-binding response regulator n=1 Tax=Actinophytocola sp. NPDC049390 TaxID=3363894 RepID=UPI00379B72DC